MIRQRNIFVTVAENHKYKDTITYSINLILAQIINYINISKTTFDFGLHKASKHHGYTKTWKQRDVVNLERVA